MIRLSLALAVVAGGGQCTDATSNVARPCGGEGCPPDLECVAETCVGADGPAYPFTLRIVPPGGDDLAAVELGDLRLTRGSTALDAPIRLPAVVPVNGQVLGPDDRSQPVRRIVVEPIGGVQAQPLAVEGAFSPINPTLFDFALTPAWPTLQGSSVPLGYRFRAALRDLPPWQGILDWSPGERQVVVRVPSTDDMPTISGEVRAFGLPVRRVRVSALDEATGRLISSVADTDLEGRFSVRLWPTGAAQSAVLVFDSADPARPLPTHRQPVTAPAAGAGAPLLVELPLPGPSERIGVRVLQPVGEARIPVAGVEVRLERALPMGVHRVRGRTDGTGTFTTLGFPGEYVVDLEPQPLGASRLSRVALGLAADDTVDALLRPRTAISGAIVDSAGRPVAEALIQATLTEARWADESLVVAGEAPPRRVFEVRSGDDGQFLFTLDPGRHRLLITPPEGTGLAPFSTTLEFQGDQPRTDVVIALPPAAVLSGAVVGPQAEPVGDAAVDVWVQSEPPIRLGRVRTAADGSFRVRLPVRLQ